MLQLQNNYPHISRPLFVFLILLLITIAPVTAQPADTTSFILSADVSYLEQLEASGVVYREDGVEDDLLAILARNGVNTIRLRLWHTPAGEWNDLESTLRMAERVRDTGLKLLLDFHYSDTWADPGRQTRPAAWQGLSYEELQNSLYTYTQRVITALQERNVTPAYVQIGNEISQGFLWDFGRVGGNFNSGSQWSQLRTLLNEASRAIRELAPDTKIIIHTDRGGDVGGATWFFDSLTAGAIDFDMVGLSYYPWWHGSLDDMENTIKAVAARYGKPVLIAETAYVWTLQWYDNTNNLVGLPEHLLPGYADLPDAQYRFLRDLIERVDNVPDGLGAGISYWAPEFVAVAGVGSVWENATLFDDSGELLPAIQAFRERVNVSNEQPEINDVIPSLNVFPNPFLKDLHFSFEQSVAGAVSVVIYDVLGRERQAVLEDRWLPAGKHQLEADVSDLPAGLYFGAIQSKNGRLTVPVIKTP